ncbi:chemotaxis protein CheW [Teichococcus aerophilus]|nr:chemotaxis protein CheW [Pseudoroseomonas aerophila]
MTEPTTARTLPTDGQDGPYLMFALGTLRCALPRVAVRELLPLPRLSRPPSLPAAVAGFLNLGGQPVPVLALEQLFGLPSAVVEADGVYRHLVLLRAEKPLALLVDRVLDLATPPPGSRRPVPPDQTLNGCVIATLAMPDGFASVLDPGRILLAQEQAMLDDLTRRERERLDAWTAG